MEAYWPLATKTSMHTRPAFSCSSHTTAQSANVQLNECGERHARRIHKELRHLSMRCVSGTRSVRGRRAGVHLADALNVLCATSCRSRGACSARSAVKVVGELLQVEDKPIVLENHLQYCFAGPFMYPPRQRRAEYVACASGGCVDRGSVVGSMWRLVSISGHGAAG